MRRSYILLPAIMFLCLYGASTVAGQAVTTDRASLPSSQPAIAGPLTSMPLAFTKNVGQWPDSILFRTSSGGATLWLTADGMYYQFTRRSPNLHARGNGNSSFSDTLGRQSDSVETTLIKAHFIGASPHVEVIASNELTYRSNYFLGTDPANWHADVPNYAAVTIKGLYPGVDITYHAEGQRLTCQYSAHDRAQLAQIQVAYQGALSVTARADGTASVKTTAGEKAFTGVLLDSGANAASAQLSSASPTAVNLIYSTYLGGSNSEEGNAIAVDAAGSAYVAGYTSSANFPTKTPYQTNQSVDDIFVTKLSAAGNSLVYSTYLGGTGTDDAEGIAVDISGNAYLTGHTTSSNFPTSTPYQTYQGPAGLADAFVTKLSSAGNSLVYSTYLGGNSVDYGYAIAIDASGNAYVTGYTNSTNFPTKSSYQADQALTDAFVTKLAPAGNTLVYSTYLGGGASDIGTGIAVDGQGYAYVTGYTASTNFPTKGSYQLDQPGIDAFITKLAVAGSSLVYSTYLGGNADDYAYGIAIDGSGNAYVTGPTGSTNFPTKTPYQTDQPLGDAFVTKLAAAGNSLVYSTYLGGDGVDQTSGITLDASGNAYVAGYTYSTDFPVLTPYQRYQTGADVFVTKLAPAGTTLAYSTYIGGNSDDVAEAITADASGNAYATGYTQSTDFPTQTPYQTDPGDATSDAFVTKLNFSLSCCTQTTRGNVNQAGIIDLSDLSLLIAYLTVTPKPPLPCLDAANVNATGIVDLSDLSLLIAYLTVTPKPTLPACP